jgi:hypothetical protein
MLTRPAAALEGAESFGVNAFGVPDVAPGAKRFWEETEEGADVAFVPNTLEDGPFVNLTEEETPGRLAKALVRGASSFGVSGIAAIFLSGLLFPKDFDGLSRMFLKMFEVEEPDELDSMVPFAFGVFNCRRGLRATESFVIWLSACRLSGVSEEEGSPDEGAFHD